MDINSSLKGVDLKKSANINIDKGAAIITYNKYKGYTLPLAVLAISVLILLFLLIPGINQLIATQKLLDEETQKLNMLQNNYNFLINLDEQQSDADLKTLTKILPIEKDFFGMMTSVSKASSVAGISIDNYKFYLGNLSKLTGEDTQYPTILMDLALSGSGVSVNNFINELYKTAPLVEVSTIKYQTGKASITLAFYFKPLPPQNIANDTPVRQLSAIEQKLLNSLRTWSNISEDQAEFFGAIGSATISGSVNFEATSSGDVEFSPFN